MNPGCCTLRNFLQADHSIHREQAPNDEPNRLIYLDTMVEGTQELEHHNMLLVLKTTDTEVQNTLLGQNKGAVEHHVELVRDKVLEGHIQQEAHMVDTLHMIVEVQQRQDMAQGTDEGMEALPGHVRPLASPFVTVSADRIRRKR